MWTASYFDAFDNDVSTCLDALMLSGTSLETADVMYSNTTRCISQSQQQFELVLTRSGVYSVGLRSATQLYGDLQNVTVLASESIWVGFRPIMF